MLRSLVPTSGLLVLLSLPASGQLDPEWVVTLSAGTALAAGPQGAAFDAAGNTYVTGVGGGSSNTNVLTAAFGPDGALRWSHEFDGPGTWHDQGRDIDVQGGIVYVTGNTPGPGNYADVLLLKYEAVTGILMDTLQYTTAPFRSESGHAVAADAAGNVFIGASTVGDGPDTMMLKFDSAGNFLWNRTWDGPAASPYSQDTVRQVQVDGNGDVLVLVHGVMGSLHPDYVVLKYDGATGATLWEANWGGSGGDFANDMVLSPSGDVFVTGIGVDFIDKISTIKLRGSDGALEWQAYDAVGLDHRASGIALDGAGDVYIAGTSDPDGDSSNANDNFLVVKRDGASGAHEWQFTYGANCVGCLDVASDVIVDASGTVHVAGTTRSAPYSGELISFLLDGGTGAELNRGLATGAGSGTLGVDAANHLYNAGATVDWTTGAKAFSVVKFTGASVSLGVNYCVSTVNSGGQATVISASGSPSVTANAFLLRADPVPGQPGLFYYGADQILALFGDGFRCVGGPVTRFPVHSGASGALTAQVDFTQLPPGAAGPIVGGSTWNFQAWYRDPAGGGAGFNLSDGLEVFFLP